MIFWVDEKRGIIKTYEDLILDINNKKNLVNYIYSDDPYQIFITLLHQIVHNSNVEMLDGDWSDMELDRLSITKEALSETCMTISTERIENIDNLIRLIKQNSDWKLYLYTSGTTGYPKKREHKLYTFIKNVKEGYKFERNVWALAYNPSHISGLLVFFQALFNKNCIVYIFDTNKQLVENLLIKYKVTNISATNTFYTSLLPYLNKQNDSLKRITFGGERFNDRIAASLKGKFPNSRARNIYASTELGEILSSTDDCFDINSIREYINISDSKELVINMALFNPDKASEEEDVWFNTGDTVEIVEEGIFRICSRKEDLVSVGGYLVNVNEVEEYIKNIEGVVDVAVVSRPNSITGNILFANVIKSSSTNEQIIEKEIIQLKIQQWKIPRIVNFVAEINHNRAGKKVR